MDAVDRRVAATVLNAARYAYAYQPIVDKPGCPGCGGDGCAACDHTGLPDHERTTVQQ